MHPEPSLRSCSAKESKGEDDLCYVYPGFIVPGKEPGSAANVEHFCNLLGRHPQIAESNNAYGQSLKWLSCIHPEVS